jgi:hypothetical protein
MLADCVTELRRRLREPALYGDAPLAYFRVRDLLDVARFVETAAGADRHPRLRPSAADS